MHEHPRRSVRSFVRRTGRLTPGQQRALDELWPRYGLDYRPSAIEFQALFGRSAPTVLEIGFGNGETLVEQASSRPESDFLGIEVHEPGIGHCMMHADAGGLTNLRLVQHDAIEVLQNQLPVGGLQRINLYFPDPWPKKRHHKRRIVQEAFLQLAAERLSDDGQLHIATDWANYAEHIDDVLRNTTLFTIVERREHFGERALDRPTTKFETRGMKKGHRIFDWAAKKNF